MNTASMNSAQLSAMTSYPIPADFYAGEENAIKVPIPGGVASLLENFRVNEDGDLQYTGKKPARIRVAGLLSFGSLKPSPHVSDAILDQGPKVAMYAFLTVGRQKGVPRRFDQTLYLPDFEWPLFCYTIWLGDTFVFMPGDTIQCYAYYNFTAPPQPPLDPTTFHVNIMRAALFLCAFSSSSPERFPIDPAPSFVSARINSELPVGDDINHKLFTFKPKVSGRHLLDVRMNILKLKLKHESGAVGPVVATTFLCHLSVNGVLSPQSLNSVGIQPAVHNDLVHLSTMAFYWLADLKETDEVSVVCMHTRDVGGIGNEPPAYYAEMTKGSILAELSMHCVATPVSYPEGLLTSSSDSTVSVPLDTHLDSAIEFPLGDAKLEFGDDFRIKHGKLEYTGKEARWFKISASLNINGLELKTSDGDPVVIHVQIMGIAVGVNGKKCNDMGSESCIYSDARYEFRLTSNQVATNVMRVRPGEIVSVLVYFFNSKYANSLNSKHSNSPPLPDRGVQKKTPAPGSSITLRGNVSVSIESMGEAE